MTETTIAVNFSFKAFNGDEITATEELLYINDQTIVFNSDIVATTSLYPIDKTTFRTDLHLTDGRTVQKKFNITGDCLVECETT